MFFGKIKKYIRRGKLAVVVCIVSMIVCLGCVAYMVWGSSNQEIANKAAEQALAKREKALVLKLRPRFKEVFQGQELKSFDQNWEPETLEELTAPLFELINSVESE